MLRESTKDPVLQKLRAALEAGEINKKDKDLSHYKNMDQLTVTEAGIIMKKEKIILPKSLIKQAIEKAHQGGHYGINTVKRRIRSHFYHPELNSSIEHYIRNCKPCALFHPVGMQRFS